MDLTIFGFGIGIIIGHMAYRLQIAYWVRKNDGGFSYEIRSAALICTGLFLVVGSKFHLFGG